MSLLYISQEITIYGGIFLFVTGTVGNGMNIFIFSSVRTYRTTPYTFYFLIGSICNILYILINLTIRVITTMYGIDLTTISVTWCKMHSFGIGLFGLTSFTCSCLATIDQYLVTSRNASLRRYSNIKLAHLIVFIVIIIWSLHGIPIFIFYDILPITKTCDSTNTIYSLYIFIYLVAYMFIIPILIMVIFGYLTYRNISLTRALAEQHADRQLIQMILIQLALVIFCMSPFGFFSMYILITAKVPKGLNQQMEEYLISTIFLLITYFYYIVCYSLSDYLH
jgi:hypothetical protein